MTTQLLQVSWLSPAMSFMPWLNSTLPTAWLTMATARRAIILIRSVHICFIPYKQHAGSFPISAHTLFFRRAFFMESQCLQTVVWVLTNLFRWARTFRNSLRSEEHTSELQSRPHLACRL